MIDQARFNGGTMAISTSTVLHRESARVVRCENGSSINVDLPTPPTDRRGRLRHLILASGAGSVVVRDQALATLTTVAAGDACRVYSGVSGWRIRKTTIGTARTVGTSTRSAVTNLPGPVVYDNLACFEGDDCDYAQSQGNEPLDGEDGRQLCVAPMFQNCATIPTNYNREPIRGADLVMPKVIVLKFSNGDFEPDSTHALAGTVLSDNFYAALYNSGKPHGLIHQGNINGPSRHWHHARWGGVTPFFGWSLPDPGTFNFKRHYWKKEISYTDDSGATRTLEIRFVMEHSVDPEPTASSTGGGQNDRDIGHWGARFGIYVFTNELSPSFVDGGTYTPTGAGSPIAFTKNDPAHWGPADGESGLKKFCHPQMVICASLPTTFEVPFGHDYVPWVERRDLKAFMGAYTDRGKNREYCYLWKNGSPWLDTAGDCSDPAPAGVAWIRNNVFGFNVTYATYAGMTTGGDIPSSKPTEYVIIENGRGVGMTYLKPLRPGWDEDCGTLTPENGSSISISICTTDDQGVDDGSGHRVWPKFLVPACAGHPDEPFEGVGGSHRCFKNNGESTETPCCVKIAQQTAGEYERCMDEYINFGDPEGCGCSIIGSGCLDSGTVWKQVVIELEDYDYAMNADQNNRVISWIRVLYDPAKVYYNNVYSPPGVDWSPELGTWSTVGNPTVTTVSGGGIIQAMLAYEPSLFTDKYRDVKIEATGRVCKSKAHGLLSNLKDNGFGSKSFYGGMIIPTSGGTTATVSIVKSIIGSLTVLKTQTSVPLNQDVVEMRFEKWGTELTFSWKKTGDTVFTSVTVEDCEITEEGWPSLAAGPAGGIGTGGTGAEFSDITVTDTSHEYVTVTANLSKNGVGVLWDRNAMIGWNLCDSFEMRCGLCSDGTTSGCEGCVCNCVAHNYTMHYSDTATFTGGGNDIVLPSCPGTNGDNPTVYGGGLPSCVCDGPFCSPGDVLPCSQCPPPFVSLYLNIWQRCLDGTIDDLDNGPVEGEPRMCTGISQWIFSPVVCS